jgi:hypothetical protein
MPKKDKLEEKKKEIEKLLTEIKNGASDVTKSEIEELEALLTSLIERECAPLWKKILLWVGSFLFHLSLMYVISMLVFGFYYDAVALPNKWLIFLVGGIISFILSIYGMFPRNPFREHFISINIMILMLIIMGIYILNRDIYPVFNTSMVWVFYIITDIAIYYLFDFFILKKILKN